MGVFIGASTRIVDRETGEVFRGEVPAYSVVVPGSLPGKATKNAEPSPSLYCAVIVKRVDETPTSCGFSLGYSAVTIFISNAPASPSPNSS